MHPGRVASLLRKPQKPPDHITFQADKKQSQKHCRKQIDGIALSISKKEDQIGFCPGREPRAPARGVIKTLPQISFSILHTLSPFLQTASRSRTGSLLHKFSQFSAENAGISIPLIKILRRHKRFILRKRCDRRPKRNFAAKGRTGKMPAPVYGTSMAINGAPSPHSDTATDAHTKAAFFP